MCVLLGWKSCILFRVLIGSACFSKLIWQTSLSSDIYLPSISTISLLSIVVHISLEKYSNINRYSYMFFIYSHPHSLILLSCHWQVRTTGPCEPQRPAIKVRFAPSPQVCLPAIYLFCFDSCIGCA